eukprot:NODE_68_length_23780_cov_0.251003.p3 type:complete len:579 gc:universal NODE_68_length_23780_cov_0.251003:4068-5804(+)
MNDLKSKSPFRKTKSGHSQHQIWENGKDVTPIPFYAGTHLNVSSASLFHSVSNANLSKVMLRSGMKSARFNATDCQSGPMALFKQAHEFVPSVTQYCSNLNEDNVICLDDETTTLDLSPVCTIININEFLCDLIIKPCFSKTSGTEYGENSVASQYDTVYRSFEDEASSDDVGDDSYTDDEENETDKSSVLSSHYSYSTARSTMKIESNERFIKLEKQFSREMMESLEQLRKFVNTKSYTADILQFYNKYAQDYKSIKMLITVKPVKYHGKCVSLQFNDQNGLLLGLFVESSFSSYLALWSIEEFFDSSWSEPRKIFSFDAQLISLLVDTNSNVLYCASDAGTLFVIAFDQDSQSCELIFDSRLLFDNEMHGITHIELSVEDSPSLLVSNIKGQLVCYKVAKRMSMSVVAFYDPHSFVFILSFCKFNNKLCLLASDGTISLVESGYTGQKCMPFLSLPSLATSIKSNLIYFGILTLNSFLISGLDFKFKPLSPGLPNSDSVSDFTFNPWNHHSCALISKKGKVFVYLLNQSTNEPQDSYFLPDRCLTSVSFTSNGHILLVGDSDGVFTVFRLQQELVS